MPIPAALAARLAKRGLVPIAQPKEVNLDDEASKGEDENSSSKPDFPKDEDEEEEEEVIAESYDDHVENQESDQLGLVRKSQLAPYSDDSNESFLDSSAKKFKGFIYCPNKNNIYHDCTKYCEEHWKKQDPDPKYLWRKRKMLSKYPLPSHWKEVYDAGIGRHYYWEVDSDSVSWLSPSHPKAVITEPAAIGRQQRDLMVDSDDNDSDEKSDKLSESSAEESEDEAEQKREVKKRKVEEIEKARAKGRSRVDKNSLDPMDPASYSDIPRGGWSDGLSKGNEAKTGVDTTASGPLYQMRPYPNPGAVLRANADTKKMPKSDKPIVNLPEMPDKPEKGKKR